MWRVHGYIRVLCSTGSTCVCGVCVYMDTHACCVYMHMYAGMCGTSKLTEKWNSLTMIISVHGYTCSDGMTTTDPLAVANTFFFMLNLPNPSPLLPEAAGRKEQHSVTMGTSLTSHAPFHNTGLFGF